MNPGAPLEVQDPSRWFVLVIFSLYSTSNAIQWVTFSSIATNTKSFFDLTTTELNMLSSVYMIVYVCGAYLTCTTFERWGVRLGLLIGGGLNALGSILKVAPALQFPCYTSIIVPQTLSALSQLFVLSTPPLIAAQYFVTRRRAFATAIMATANNIGNALALIVPPFIVNKGEKSEFMLLFCLIMGYCVILFGAVIVFVKPPRFQSPSAALLGIASPTTLHPAVDGEFGSDVFSQPSAQPRGTRESALPAEPTLGDEGEADGGEDTRSESKRKPLSFTQKVLMNEHVITFIEVGRIVYSLMCRRDFVFLLCAFSISMGSVWTFASVLAQILEPFGVSAELAGIAGALNVAFGVAMAYIVGLWVDRKRHYKIPVLVCLAGSVVCCVALVVVMLRAPPNTSIMNGMSMFIYIFAGLFQNTATPIAFEFAMEITYPIAESVPGALLMAGANLVSLILLSISSSMLGNGVTEPMSAVYVVVLITCVCAVGTVLAMLPRERLYRQTAQLVARESAHVDTATELMNMEKGKVRLQGNGFVEGSQHSDVSRKGVVIEALNREPLDEREMMRTDSEEVNGDTPERARDEVDSAFS